MAYADLSSQAKEGLVYGANKLNAEDKEKRGAMLPDGVTPRPDLYADGKALMDWHAEQEGCRWYELKMATKREKRIAALEKPANSALAAQVDALG